MALQLNDYLYWMQIQAYVKISWVDIRENWEFENWNKKYIVKAILNYYTDNTKNHHYKQELEVLEDLQETELILPIIYSKIMNLTKFSSAIFI